jgi:hypothetical protein
MLVHFQLAAGDGAFNGQPGGPAVGEESGGFEGIVTRLVVHILTAPGEKQTQQD